MRRGLQGSFDCNRRPVSAELLPSLVAGTRWGCGGADILFHGQRREAGRHEICSTLSHWPNGTQ